MTLSSVRYKVQNKMVVNCQTADALHQSDYTGSMHKCCILLKGSDIRDFDGDIKKAKYIPPFLYHLGFKPVHSTQQLETKNLRRQSNEPFPSFNQV